jgi:hypothetical protein
LFQTNILIQPGNSKERANAHLVGLTSGHLDAYKPTDGLQTALIGPRSASQNSGRGTI